MAANIEHCGTNRKTLKPQLSELDCGGALIGNIKIREDSDIVTLNSKRHGVYCGRTACRFIHSKTTMILRFLFSITQAVVISLFSQKIK